MLNLSKAVDRILEVEPGLSPILVPIKQKWERSHRTIYWTHLLKVLNTAINPVHPSREKIQSILVPKKKKSIKKLYTFEPPSPVESVIGIIPENLEGKIRRYDRIQINLSKDLVEARMTHNEEMMVELGKKNEILELNQKKIWIDIKNHFNLWEINNPMSFFIRIKDNLLVLTSIKIAGQQQSGPEITPGNFMLKMDDSTLRRFLKFFNLNFGGLMPPEDENE